MGVVGRGVVESLLVIVDSLLVMGDVVDFGGLPVVVSLVTAEVVDFGCLDVFGCLVVPGLAVVVCIGSVPSHVTVLLKFQS